MPSAPDGDSLPSADELKAYEKAFPGMARELFEMAKADQKHLHEMERAEASLSKRGQLFGLIIALSFLIAASILISSGQAVAGTIIGSTDLVALVTVFVIGRKTERSLQDKSLDRILKEINRPTADAKRVRKRKPREAKQSALSDKPETVDGQPARSLRGLEGAGNKPDDATHSENNPDAQSQDAVPVIQEEETVTSSSTNDKQTGQATLDSDNSVKPSDEVEAAKLKATPRELSEEDRRLWKRFSREMGLDEEAE